MFGFSLHAQEEGSSVSVAETPVSIAEVESSENNPSTVIESQEEESTLDSGNTAWMITATALVLFMTLPGLGAFLWWLGAVKKCALSVDALFCNRLPCVLTLVRDRLQFISHPGRTWRRSKKLAWRERCFFPTTS